MPQIYDSIIIGAGLNGLTAAAYLAKAGLKVLVLERRAVIGGSAATEEVFPGFKFDTVTHAAGPLPTEIVRDLGLSQRGLEVLRGEATSFTPLPDGGALTLWHDLSRSAESIRRFSKTDADKWATFAQYLHRLATFMEAVNGVPIPSIATTDIADVLKVAGLGNAALQLGQAGLVEFLRTLPKSIAELLNDWFEFDALKGTLGMAGVLGMRQGVRATSTGYVFLHRHAGMRLGAFRSAGAVRGGLGSLAYALSTAARQAGAEIRVNAEVAQIVVSDDRAVGVALSNGEEIRANVILSGASPRRTFLELLDPLTLGADFSWKAQRIRYKGAFAKVNLALAGLPTFTAQPNGAEHLQGVISIGPSLDYIERASDAVKYGQWAERPVLEAVIPSLLDPSRAPHGQHTMSIWAQYVPYALEGGWTDAKRQQLGDWVIGALSEYAPNLQSLILHSQVLTPLDLESEYSLPEGDIFHGEMALDQLFFMRPVPGWAQYATPVAGLYLCGSGAHPGGALWPGRNAAKQVLLDLKPKR